MHSRSTTTATLFVFFAGLFVPRSAAAYVTLADVARSPTPITWEEVPTVALDTRGLSEAEQEFFERAPRLGCDLERSGLRRRGDEARSCLRGAERGHYGSEDRRVAYLRVSERPQSGPRMS